MSEETSAPSANATAPADDEGLPQLEDAGTPEAKHGGIEDAADEQIRGEWQRAGEMQQESDHLREVLDDARQAVAKASAADSMESGGAGVRPEDVQDTGSGDAEKSDAEKSDERDEVKDGPRQARP